MPDLTLYDGSNLAWRQQLLQSAIIFKDLGRSNTPTALLKKGLLMWTRKKDYRGQEYNNYNNNCCNKKEKLHSTTVIQNHLVFLTIILFVLSVTNKNKGAGIARK